MNFKGFKKVQEDDKMATMAHPSGHQVKIVKSSLSDDHRKQLSELPLHQADPKEEVKDPNLPQDKDELPFVDLPVADPNASSPDSSFTPTPAGQAPDINPPMTPTQPPTVAAGNAPIAPPAPVNPNPITGQPSAMGAASQFPAISQGEAAAYESKKAAEQTGADLAAAQVSHNKELQAQAVKEQAHFQAMMDERNKVVQDIKDGYINPNHYLESKGTLGKITTALGLLLGGLGSGFTHGPNQALQYLQSQQERDLQAQKANLGAKENLLTALNQQYHNTEVADNMYRSIMMQRHANDLQTIAAKAGISQANPNFHQALSALAGQSQELLIRAHKLQMQDEVENPQKGAQPAPGMPAQAEQWGPDKDAKVSQLRQYAAAVGDDKTVKDLDSRYVPGVGLAKVPLDDKDREFLTKSKNLQSMFGEAQDLLKQTGYGTVPYSQLSGTAGNKSREIQLTMGDIANLSRFTGEENKIYKQDVPDLAGTHFTNTDKAKLDSLEDSHQRNAANFYRLKGLPPPPERRVPIVGPDGKPYTIPKSQLSRLPKGYRAQ